LAIFPFCSNMELSDDMHKRQPGAKKKDLSSGVGVGWAAAWDLRKI
jgi:hypothetical protein